MSTKFLRMLALLLAFSFVAAACSSDDDSSAGSSGAPTPDTEAPAVDDTEAPPETDAPADTEPPATTEAAMSEAEQRCQTNQDAGTVTFVTGFDFAAAAGIVEVIVADAQGFFEEVCLDVEIQPGFAPSNGALVIEGQAQMSSAGSFSELVNNNVAGEGDLVALLHLGRTAIEAIVLPEGSEATSFGDLCGGLVGIKGDLPYSLQAAIALDGADRSCFDEVLLDGFNPADHLALGIDALPVYKSNEPNALEGQGIPFTVLDPLDFDVPSSFAIPFTSQAFLDENPTVVEDFIRALLKGYEFAAANPDEAVANAFELIDAAGNPLFLAQEVELNRWNVEAGIIADLAPGGVGIGVPDVELLGSEIEVMVSAGVFAELPDWESMINTDVAAGLYDGTTLIWPGS